MFILSTYVVILYNTMNMKRKKNESAINEIEQLRQININLKREISNLIATKNDLTQEIKDLKNKIKYIQELFFCQQKTINNNIEQIVPQVSQVTSTKGKGKNVDFPP